MFICFSGVACSSGGNCFLKDVKHRRNKPGKSEVRIGSCMYTENE